MYSHFSLSGYKKEATGVWLCQYLFPPLKFPSNENGTRENQGKQAMCTLLGRPPHDTHPAPIHSRSCYVRVSLCLQTHLLTGDGVSDKTRGYNLGSSWCCLHVRKSKIGFMPRNNVWNVPVPSWTCWVRHCKYALQKKVSCFPAFIPDNSFLLFQVMILTPPSVLCIEHTVYL